jgi:rubrerythrin
VSKKPKELAEMGEKIAVAIAREQASIKFYTEAFVDAKTEDHRRMFLHLIEQEEEHEAKLKALLSEIKAEIEVSLRKSK